MAQIDAPHRHLPEIAVETEGQVRMRTIKSYRDSLAMLPAQSGGGSASRIAVEDHDVTHVYAFLAEVASQAGA